MSFNIVLIEPEIPNNTGNIGRLSLATNSHLHLVKPFGFEISDSRLKRAGLDYWKHIQLTIYENIDEFFEKNNPQKMVFLSSKATKSYLEIPFQENIFFVFGKESVGLSEEILRNNSENQYAIPLFSDKVRSLNLANAVGIVVYEGLRVLNN